VSNEYFFVFVVVAVLLYSCRKCETLFWLSQLTLLTISRMLLIRNFQKFLV